MLLSVVGCATTDDLRRVHGDLARQIQVTNEKIVSVEQGWAPLKDELKDEIEGLRKEIAKTNEAIPSQGNQAGGTRGNHRNPGEAPAIRGIDGLRKELSTASLKTTKREEEEKILREKLDNLTFKINFIENFLGIGKKDEPAESPAEKAGKQAPAADAARHRKDGRVLYAAAYGLFKEEV